MSAKQALLNLCGKRVFEEVVFPDPIGTVLMRSLMASEAAQIASYQYDPKTGQPVPGREKYVFAKRLSMTIVDADHNLMFGEEDLDALIALPEAISDTFLEAYRRMNRMEYAADLVKNLRPAS